MQRRLVTTEAHRSALGVARPSSAHVPLAGPTVSVYSDRSWAGCTRTRKSPSGACLLHGEHLIRSYAKTQSVISLSGAEAELHATTM